MFFTGQAALTQCVQCTRFLDLHGRDVMTLGDQSTYVGDGSGIPRAATRALALPAANDAPAPSASATQMAAEDALLVVCTPQGEWACALASEPVAAATAARDGGRSGRLSNVRRRRARTRMPGTLRAKTGGVAVSGGLVQERAPDDILRHAHIHDLPHQRDSASSTPVR